MSVPNIPTMADLVRFSASQHQPSQERSGFSPSNLATLRSKLAKHSKEIGLTQPLSDREGCLQIFNAVILKHHPKDGPKGYKPRTYLDYSQRYVKYHDLFFSLFPLAKETHFRTFISPKELQEAMEAGGESAFGTLAKIQNSTAGNVHTNYGRYLKALKLFRAFLVDTIGPATDEVPIKTIGENLRRDRNFQKWLMKNDGLGIVVADKKVARVNFLLETIPVWHKTPEALLVDSPQAELFPSQKEIDEIPQKPSVVVNPAAPMAEPSGVVFHGNPEAPIVITVPVEVSAPQKKGTPPTLGVVVLRALLKFADKKSLLQSFNENEPFVAMATIPGGGAIRVERDGDQTLTITLNAQAVASLPLERELGDTKPRRRKSMTTPSLSSLSN